MARRDSLSDVNAMHISTPSSLVSSRSSSLDNDKETNRQSSIARLIVQSGKRRKGLAVQVIEFNDSFRERVKSIQGNAAKFEYRRTAGGLADDAESEADQPMGVMVEAREYVRKPRLKEVKAVVKPKDQDHPVVEEIRRRTENQGPHPVTNSLLEDSTQDVGKTRDSAPTWRDHDSYDADDDISKRSQIHPSSKVQQGNRPASNKKEAPRKPVRPTSKLPPPKLIPTKRESVDTPAQAPPTSKVAKLAAAKRAAGPRGLQEAHAEIMKERNAPQEKGAGKRGG